MDVFLNKIICMHPIEYYRDEFITYLESKTSTKEPINLYAPINYILGLGGKRLRPVLVLMTADIFGCDYKKALDAALAIEVFHNFSLVHDDIMDEAPLRRGKATIHQKYDINTGILSGDVMLIYAYKYLLDIEKKEVIPEILSIFTKVSADVCIGQQYDINFETAKQVTIEEYLKMIELKTAALIAGAMYTGALLAGASKVDCQNLYEFGLNIGTAFQLQDDILDTYGDAATFGKRIGGDIVQNKKTYLVLTALERANSTQKKQLENLLSSHPVDEEAKIEEVTQLFNELNIKELANKKRDEYHLKAVKNLESLAIEGKKLIPLKNVAESLLKRVQ